MLKQMLDDSVEQLLMGFCVQKKEAEFAPTLTTDVEKLQKKV